MLFGMYFPFLLPPERMSETSVWAKHLTETQRESLQLPSFRPKEFPHNQWEVVVFGFIQLVRTIFFSNPQYALPFNFSSPNHSLLLHWNPINFSCCWLCFHHKLTIYRSRLPKACEVIIIPQILIPRRASLFPGPAPTISTPILTIQAWSKPKPHTDTVLSDCCRTGRRRENYLPACPYLIKFWLCTKQVFGKLQPLPGKHYLVQTANHSCWRQQMGFQEGDQQLFLPKALLKKAVWDQRHSPTQQCGYSSAPAMGKNIQLCTSFICHQSNGKVPDCSAKRNACREVWEKHWSGAVSILAGGRSPKWLWQLPCPAASSAHHWSLVHRELTGSWG